LRPIDTKAALTAQAYALYRLLVDTVIRGDDGATYSAISTRALTSDANIAAALLGLTTNSRPSVIDEIAGTYARQQGLQDGVTGAYVLQPRESAFPASRSGRRFYTTHQTPGTVVTGQTSFVATTPTFLLRQAASTRRVILRSIMLSQDGTVAGGKINVAVVLDTADRFSAGGTAIVPQNPSGPSAVASAITSFLFNPTATAAGGGTRVLVQAAAVAALGSVLSIDFKDGVIVGTTGALLIYTWAATTGPSWQIILEWEEVA
jgi:hypothetical protein